MRITEQKQMEWNPGFPGKIFQELSGPLAFFVKFPEFFVEVKAIFVFVQVR